jgi:hypothetical protein
MRAAKAAGEGDLLAHRRPAYASDPLRPALSAARRDPPCFARWTPMFRGLPRLLFLVVAERRVEGV